MIKTPLLDRIILAAIALPSILANAYDTPSTISSSLLSEYPYSATGFVYYISGGYIYMGSGFLVNDRVILTAAHMAFDSDTMSWVSGIQFDLAFNNTYSNANGANTAGTMYLASYSTELASWMNEPGYESGTSNNATFNSDIVAIYATSVLSSEYGNYSIYRSGEPSIAAEQWEMMMLGYPTDDDYISSSNQGKMHQTGSNTWSMTDIYGDNNGKASVDSVFASLYSSSDLAVYGGNSGGPLFAYDADDGLYTEVGIAVGGNIENKSAYSIFRIIDENAEELIEEAIDASSSVNALIPTTLTADAEDTGVYLSWKDSSSNETGWELRRNDGDAWDIIATTANGTRTYTDTSAESGITYQYSVRPIKTLSSGYVNRGAWCTRASAGMGGANEPLADAIGAPYVYVQSSGDAPYYASDDGSVAYSGKILNNQESDLTLTLVGPGTLTYTAVLSSKTGDYLTVYYDSTSNAFFHASQTYSAQTVSISSGTHTVKFAYTKDSYNTSGSDNVTIKDLSYYCSNSAEAFQGGVVTSGNGRYSTIIGNYYNYGNSWIYSSDLGFAYMYPQSSQSVWITNEVQWMYLYDSDFGWCGFSMTGWPWMWSAEKGWICARGDGWFWVWDDQKFEER
jgi:V8-like Glu-specific endopeptidase